LFGEPLELLSRARPGIARAVVHAPIPTQGLTMDDLVSLRRKVYEVIEGPLAAEAGRATESYRVR
jgi:hypothetical protein